MADADAETTPNDCPGYNRRLTREEREETGCGPFASVRLLFELTYGKERAYQRWLDEGGQCN